MAMIHLPFPPSVNHLFRGGKGRYRTNAYKAWSMEACCALRQIRPDPVTEPYHLEITLQRPKIHRRRDCSNYAKAIEDLLVEHEITPDDSLAQSVTIRWADAVEGPVVRVEAS